MKQECYWLKRVQTSYQSFSFFGFPHSKNWDAWLTIVICITFLFAISAFVLQPERGSFQSPRPVTTGSRASCASNIWQKRQEKQQLLAELQPANQTDEELQLQIALELSKKQAEIDAQRRYKSKFVENPNTVKLPVSNHSKCQDLVVTYRWWLHTRINPQVISSEKSSRHIYILLHTISKLRCVYFHVVTQCSWYTLSGKKILRTKISHHAYQVVTCKKLKTMKIMKP